MQRLVDKESTTGGAGMDMRSNSISHFTIGLLSFVEDTAAPFLPNIQHIT
jgi:hypothetical protein